MARIRQEEDLSIGATYSTRHDCVQCGASAPTPGKCTRCATRKIRVVHVHILDTDLDEIDNLRYVS